MTAMKNKIKSQRGASITFALLIFLVCTVISSAVIVAATTAAGRLSTMDEMDERYYAVTDACELLCDIFDGKTVTVAYTRKADKTIDTATAVDPTDANVILKDASEKLIKGVKGNILPTGFTHPVEITRKEKKYNVDISETLEEGTLIFDVSAEGGTINSGTYKSYKLSAIFASNVKYSEMNSSATVTWKLRSLKKNRPVVVVPPAGNPGT